MEMILAATAPHTNQLPVEVLGRCFELLSVPDRIRSATVCKYWRSVALDHAELWCELENVGVDAIPDLLARTKRLSVRLIEHVVPDASIETLCEAILPHMDHIRALDLELKPWMDQQGMPSALGDVLSAQAPRLEEFSLVVRNEPMSLHQPLFGGVAPKLNSLRKEGWTFTVPSAATLGVVSFRAPAALTDGEQEQALLPSYTGAWGGMFPALRELWLTRLFATAGLWTAAHVFTTQLTTLVLEFARDAPAGSSADAFRLLQDAKFGNMREVTVVYAKPALLDLVLQSIGDKVVSLELNGSGPHVRMRTNTGTAINFMRSANLHDLDGAVSRNIDSLAAHLRTLHLGAGAVGVFDGATLTQLCADAQALEQIVLTGVPQDVMWDMQDVLEPGRALREVRVRAAGRCVWADELAQFVRERLQVDPDAGRPTLTLEGVEISDEREGCAVSRAELDDILQTTFGAIIVVVPAPQAEGAQQHAERFVSPRDRRDPDLWYARGD